MNLENLQSGNQSSIGEKIKFKDGTEYLRMPNGELRRMSPKAAQIRKMNKKQIK